MKIKARFKGVRRLPYFIPEHDYSLNFRTQNEPSKPYYNHIIIIATDRFGSEILNTLCPYESLKGFLKNWEVL